MGYKSAWFRLVLFLLLLACSTPLLAQEALTQTFTSSDGMLTMSFPEGWTVEEEDGLIRFSSNQAFVQVNYYDYGEQVTALEILEIGAAEYLGFSAPEKLVFGGYSALQAAGEDQLHTVINFCGGIFGLVIGYVQPRQVEAYKPTINAMMDTIRFGEGEAVLCQGAFDNLTLINPANASQIAQVQTMGDAAIPVTTVAFSPDGGTFAAGMLDGNVKIWSTVTGGELYTLDGHRDGATGIAFSDGGYNIAVGTGNGRVWMWDATTGEASGALQRHSSPIESVAFMPDGFLIASGSLDGEVRLWDMIAYGEREPLIDDALTPVESVAFSPDGSLLAAGGGSTIRVWDVEAGIVQNVLETEIVDVHSVAFSPDGTQLAYGGADPVVWVWNIASNDNRPLLTGDAKQVLAVAFSPDGQMIVSGDSDATRLWNATTGENLATLASPSGEAVNSVAFSPDGTLIASGGVSGGVVLWGVAGGGGAAEQDDVAASPDTGEEGQTTTTEETTTSTASSCTITAPGNANLRSGPGTNFERAGSLAAGQSAEVDGQAQGGDGMTWYRLTEGAWVRSDVIGSPTECVSVTVVTP